MTERRRPNKTEMLAATLLALGHVGYEHAKQMTAAQIISLYQFDHYPIRYEDGGPTAPWNLVPRLIAAHRRKTATVDRPQSAKGKRVRRSLTEHQIVMRAKILANSQAEFHKRIAKKKIASRGFSKGHRPMQSRGWA